ncbi:UNVERIFIED_CONTAM: hypothetical protein Sangu_1822300 [Sesamum angustifolium]|uniref:Uncharacterized protein n=1 Tax=Sesamum angustifolium TaxID=2727405 RepID=A0AAW2MAH3_9LAMI
MRRRRNLLACSLNWDKNRSCSPLRSNGGGISKRMTGSPRSTLALAVAMSNSDIDKQGGECNSAGSLLVSSPRRNFPVWRSLSYAHLQPCASVATHLSIQISSRRYRRNLEGCSLSIGVWFVKTSTALRIDILDTSGWQQWRVG